jgi:DinB superfamily
MASLDDLTARLQRVADDLASLAPDIERRAPWALSSDFGTGPEASWGPPEVLAHIAEMVPYWLGEIERILDGPEDAATPFGRVSTDTVRLEIIGRDRTIPVRELLARIVSETRRASDRLAELTDSDGARRGLHPRLGEMVVTDIVERFLATHAEEHVQQLREILAAVG